MWNLLEPTAPGEIVVTDVTEEEVRSASYRTCEAFAAGHPGTTDTFTGTIWDDPAFQIECRIVDHRTPCLAYTITEKSRTNIDPSRMTALGLKPGPWCATLKSEEHPDEETLELGGQSHTLGALRAQLLTLQRGKKLSYLTDLLMTDQTEAMLLALMRGSDVLIAECSYRQSEADLARAYYHLTTTQVGEFAARAEVRELVLFHLSPRYEVESRPELLGEVQAVFPNARFPEGW
jgi:ribonuclease Z